MIELIKVAIIDDHPVMREALRKFIDRTPGYCCIGTSCSVEEAIQSISLETAHVLLLDIQLPGMSGSEGVRVLQERFPLLQILMLTTFEEDEKIFESICNGARGYLLKQTPSARLLEAIREAHEGSATMSAEVARQVIRLFQKIEPAERPEHNLTADELRLLQLLAAGHSDRGVAKQLGISINTVRRQIIPIYNKLHMHSKTAAVQKALKRLFS